MTSTTKNAYPVPYEARRDAETVTHAQLVSALLTATGWALCEHADRAATTPQAEQLIDTYEELYRLETPEHLLSSEVEMLGDAATDVQKKMSCKGKRSRAFRMGFSTPEVAYYLYGEAHSRRNQELFRE